MRHETKSLLLSLLKELTVSKAVFFLFMLLLAGNLSALVDAVFHPEIPYLDEEHLIIGGAYALFLTAMFLTLAIYITKLKKATETQRASEEKFRVLAEKSPNMIFINKRGQVIYANEKCSELMGYTRDEFLSPDFDFLTLIAPESLELVKKAYSQQMKGKDVPPFEYVLLTRDGRRIAVILTSKLIDIGEETAILGIITDITEHKRAEDEIKRSKEEWERTFNAISEPIMILDVNHRIVKANKAMADKLGVTATEAQGLTCYKAVHGRQEPHPDCPHSALLADGQVHSAEIYEERLGGYFMITVSPIYDSEGRLIGSIHAGHDITNRKKMEEELRILNENLEVKVSERTRELETAMEAAEAGNRAKTEFIANMSHEIRTPLNAIIGFSEVLRDGIIGPLTKEQAEYMNDIVRNGRHLLDLILNILAVAEAESGRMKLRPEKIRLSDLFQSALSLVRDEVLQKKIVTDYGISPEADIDIEADSSRLRQVMVSLLDNAVKFTPEGGSVRVSARRVDSSQFTVHCEENTVNSEPSTVNDRDFVEISVTDTGIGIKPEDMSRLFRPLQQLESPYTKKYRGTGLGLLLTKKLIELHGGKIRVESEFGKGSTFTFVIPMKQTGNNWAGEKI